MYDAAVALWADVDTAIRGARDDGLLLRTGNLWMPACGSLTAHLHCLMELDHASRADVPSAASRHLYQAQG